MQVGILVEQIEHADEVGLDTFGVGEHHRREFLDSAPAVILGAAAARTQRIRLTSAVTVQMNVASLPQVKMMRAIDAIGARVAPALQQVGTAPICPTRLEPPKGGG